MTPATPTARRRDTLWLLAVAPTVWGLHLLASYISAAVWCAKFAAPGAPLGIIRTAIVWYTVAALAAITAIGWEGLRRHRLPSASPDKDQAEVTTHDLDTPEDQHRFLGFATLLLAGLSAVAVLYAALAAVYFETCG